MAEAQKNVFRDLTTASTQTRPYAAPVGWSVARAMSTKIGWPDKATGETWQIEQFIDNYRRFPSERDFEIVTKRENPDWIVRDKRTGERFGVELTSPYLDDRSVPDEHIPDGKGLEEIPFDAEKLRKYIVRLVQAVQAKVRKAQKGYDTSAPLILSVWVNEYISLHLRRHHLEQMVRENREVFYHMSPFVEIIFWDLPNKDAMSVRLGYVSNRPVNQITWAMPV